MRGTMGKTADECEDGEREPSYVGRAPVRVTRDQVQGPLHVRVGPDQEPDAGVHEPLRLRRRARGVDDESRLVRLERYGGRASFRAQEELCEVVLTLPERMVLVDATSNDDVGDREALHRFVEGALERQDLAAPERRVGRDDDFRKSVLEAVADRGRAESR